MRKETEFELARRPKGFLIMVRDVILRPPIYATFIEKAELHYEPTVRPASDIFLLFVGALEVGLEPVRRTGRPSKRTAVSGYERDGRRKGRPFLGSQIVKRTGPGRPGRFDGCRVCGWSHQQIEVRMSLGFINRGHPRQDVVACAGCQKLPTPRKRMMECMWRLTEDQHGDIDEPRTIFKLRSPKFRRTAGNGSPSTGEPVPYPSRRREALRPKTYGFKPVRPGRRPVENGDGFKP
ncbi:hypothetical protein DFH08DRAFT_1027307 [Mycena albidolilacea]|uniref:Uncharacterized protein n=1 Tax=Mycena albidolilacea TaxID=1033008 RepID=A0AAD7EIF2_9AGAR|nr:hypothetical protein DFH08DRAFT_1027307 [Mycena albidolilacea]